MNASVAIQTLPEVYDNDEIVRIVDEVIAYIKNTGYKYSRLPSKYYEISDVLNFEQTI